MAQTLLTLVADLQVSLAAATPIGATTATLSVATDSGGVALPSGKYGFTVDGDTSAKEYIVCDLVGTTVTNVQNITYQGGASTGFDKYHRYGATVTITDWAILSRMLNLLNGATGFDSNAPIGYDGAPASLTGNQFATVNYVLSVVNGGPVTFNQQILSSQTSGEALTVNDSVYFKTSDQKWYKTDADVAATATGVRTGFTVASVGANATVQIQVSGSLSGFTGLTAGSKYYASGTAGAVTLTPPVYPSYEIFVGWALSTTSLLMGSLPNLNQFSGTTLPPSSVNKLLDQASASDGSIDQQQATQNGTSPAGQASTTGLRAKVAQSFIPTKTIVKSVNLYKSANTGTFAGTVTVSIQADSAGSPSGVALATKTITSALYNAYSTGNFLAIFAAETSVTPGNLYWVVIETSTTDTSNCINLGTNTAGGYSSGSVKGFNATDSWFAVATIDLYFAVNQGFNGKEMLANSTGYVPVAVRKVSMKTGTVATATTGTAVTHAFGYLPTLVRGYYNEADSSHVAYSVGTYDVTNAAYIASSVSYNEGTSGGGEITTNKLVATGATSTVAVTVLVDENVVVFISASGTPTIGYEIIG